VGKSSHKEEIELADNNRDSLMMKEEGVQLSLQNDQFFKSLKKQAQHLATKDSSKLEGGGGSRTLFNIGSRYDR
jgi:hypothetical protein